MRGLASGGRARAQAGWPGRGGLPSHLGALGPGDQRLAHVADRKHGGRLHIIPVLLGEGVHAAQRGERVSSSSGLPSPPACPRGPQAHIFFLPFPLPLLMRLFLPTAMVLPPRGRAALLAGLQSNVGRARALKEGEPSRRRGLNRAPLNRRRSAAHVEPAPLGWGARSHAHIAGVRGPAWRSGNSAGNARSCACARRRLHPPPLSSARPLQACWRRHIGRGSASQSDQQQVTAWEAPRPMACCGCVALLAYGWRDASNVACLLGRGSLCGDLTAWLNARQVPVLCHADRAAMPSKWCLLLASFHRQRQGIQLPAVCNERLRVGSRRRSRTWPLVILPHSILSSLPRREPGRPPPLLPSKPPPRSRTHTMTDRQAHAVHLCKQQPCAEGRRKSHCIFG